MNTPNQTQAEMIRECLDFAAILRQSPFSYETADYRYTRISPDGFRNHYFTLCDPFQSGSEGYYADTYGFCVEQAPGDSLSMALADWPNREQRELHVLASKASDVAALSDHMASIAAQSFLADLKRDCEPLFRALTHIKAG